MAACVPQRPFLLEPGDMPDFPQERIHYPQLRSHQLLVRQIRYQFQCLSSSVTHPGCKRRVTIHRTIDRIVLGSHHAFSAINSHQATPTRSIRVLRPENKKPTFTATTCCWRAFIALSMPLGPSLRTETISLTTQRRISGTNRRSPFRRYCRPET